MHAAHVGLQYTRYSSF